MQKLLYLCALFMGKRITYWDVARGLAVLLVIFYHVPLYIRICHPSATELLMPHINAGTYILPFFMPVFFIISGYFTNTEKPYWSFLWGDIKHLLLIGLALTFINVSIQFIGLWDTSAIRWFVRTLFSKPLDVVFSNWFVSAIFFSRQIYYGADRLAEWVVKKQNWQYWVILFGVLVVIALTGIVLEPNAPHNGQWFYCQGLVFAVFVAFGKVLHTFTIDRKWFLGIGGIYIALMIIARVVGISTLEYGMINTSFTVTHWPFYMVLALSGSALLIGCAQLIDHFKPLEFIGRHSLTFYIPQGGVLLVSATLLGKILSLGSVLSVWLYIVAMWCICLCALSLLSVCQDGWNKCAEIFNSKVFVHR